ncbi:NADH-quinone oxidoreductase subunit NuoK [Planctomicrobium sp. SH527]|uniref:NADH-quinone oxidoreductase subunit NuoK n=1 Tax=Planctomicrobium sp. SH527 TaxID=3448123 RepID=UPI003F5C2C19
MTGDIERYLAVAAGLFAIGAIGFLTRRNLILLFLSVELMMHGVGLTFVTFSRMHFTLEGHAMTVLSLTVAACEAGLALALILALFHISRSLDIELWSDLREPDLSIPISPSDLDPVTPPAEQEFPKLTPAGRAPVFPRKPVVIKTSGSTSRKV